MASLPSSASSYGSVTEGAGLAEASRLAQHNARASGPKPSLTIQLSIERLQEGLVQARQGRDGRVGTGSEQLLLGIGVRHADARQARGFGGLHAGDGIFDHEPAQGERALAALLEPANAEQVPFGIRLALA